MKVAKVKWAMERDNGWLVWDKAKFRTIQRAEKFIVAMRKECPRARRITMEFL